LLKNESLSNEKVKVAKEEEKPNLDVILRETRWPPGHPGVWAPSDSSSGLEFSRMGKQIDRKNVFSLSLSLSLSQDYVWWVCLRAVGRRERELGNDRE
jgi:hypothetical protein